MEQPVWISIGIMSVIITLGLIGTVVMDHKERTYSYTVDNSLDKLEHQCNFVCSAVKGNRFGIEVKLPAGTELYTNENRVCITYEDKTRCRLCGCLLDEYNLSVTGELAEELESLEYQCTFEKDISTVKMSCEG